MYKGYYTSQGYMGLTDSGWMLFATESDYKEWRLLQDVRS